MGDAAASLVGPQIYEEFVLPYEKRLVDGLHAMGTKVRLHICGNTQPNPRRHGQPGLRDRRYGFEGPAGQGPRGDGAAAGLCGNIDPVKTLRNGTPADGGRGHRPVPAEAGPRYIIAAGCEVPRDTPAENLRAMLGDWS